MQLYTEVIGTGYPVVFLHGLALDMTSMQAWYEPLLAQQPIQRIYLDLPGMGKSPAVPLAQANSDAILAGVQATIQALIGHTNYAVVGHSYGGYLALGLAYQDSHVSQLFTTCPAFTAVSDQRILAQHDTESHGSINYQTNLNKVPAYEQMSVILSPQTWQAYQQQILPGIARCDVAFIHQLQRAHSAYYRFSFEPELQAATLSQPQTMLLGRADNQVGYQEQLAYLQRQPQSTVGVFKRAGHNLPLDQPDLLAAYFKEFVTTLTERMIG
ncbi:alpha/beta fold hydrolase [Lactiplantibacillus daowaiensis]|uniref:Alpha/beta fold hydrolase n=1 Tax=Lactiplantibacillus daowaiensis TaxID=2559918 RepID=A0ABW1S061_9LACO|nr:alpha/beta hydrolase [Lactiplantibacillus daowaiensis]